MYQKFSTIKLKTGLPKLISNITIWVINKVYTLKVFTYLKLNSNMWLREIIETEGYIKEKIDYNEKIDSVPTLLPHSLTFTDAFEIDDISKVKQNLINLFYRLDLVRSHPLHDIDRRLSGLEKTYNTVQYGDLCTINLKNKPGIKLIDSLRISYLKGPHSYFLLTYHIMPNESFLDRFKEIIKIDTKQIPEFEINNFRQIFFKREIIASYMYWVVYPYSLVQDLYMEVAIELKKVFAGYQIGVFTSENKHLYPCIVSYGLNKAEYEKQLDLYHRVFNEGGNDFFVSKEQHVFSFDTPDLVKFPSSVMNIFVNASKYEDDTEKYYNSLDYLSYTYAKELAPSWFLLNYISLHRSKIIDIRKQVFRHTKEMSDTLFLKKSLKINKLLSRNLFDFNRFKNDFISDISSIDNLPEAYYKSFVFNDSKNKAFKEHFNGYLDYILEDTTNTYKTLMEAFKQATEGNVIQSNMRLQKILFWIGVVGFCVAIYGAFNDFINGWIQYFLKMYFDFKFPKAPTP
ncbi:hypothetical protein QNI16_14655 [Cytophagaceae bacterium YF14B1]|uniref:Uncharacterized protein n=1 Tax=Xanthocytophaga flava TaxID=3048013 RepID=A0AAE3QQU9_9BACT|nr:hypothetical protein [Xanthocytophaga flavus]MDJ1481738.1 hypothetical protein [Xanthocytophaga flavus]